MSQARLARAVANLSPGIVPVFYDSQAESCSRKMPHEMVATPSETVRYAFVIQPLSSFIRAIDAICLTSQNLVHPYHALRRHAVVDATNPTEKT